MKSEHLHLLIDEEIYLIKSQGDKLQVASDKLEAEDLSVDSPQPSVESDAKTSISNSQIEKIQFAFIHDTDKQEELDLLNNIIAACKLDSKDFRITKKDKAPNYENAVIFTSEANQFYSSTQVDNTKILYSKPLAILLNSKEEKGNLWGALQVFVKQ